MSHAVVSPACCAAARCPLCGEPTQPLHAFPNYSTWRCGRCDHDFSSFSESSAAATEVWSDQWLDGRAASVLTLNYLAGHRLRVLKRLGAAPGRLLEVGCGTGEFLLAAAAAGYDVLGLDTSPGAVAVARRHLRESRVSCGHLHELAADANGFDIVAGFHVLEHVPDPVAFAGELLQRVRPGGWCYLRVPNARGAVSRLAGEHFYIATHLSHFSSASLRRVLAAAGFEDIEIFTEDFGGRWLDLLMTPVWRLSIRFSGALNRKAYASEERAGSDSPARSPLVSALRACKRSGLFVYQLAGLGTHFLGYPVWRLLGSWSRGGELVVLARRPETRAGA